MPAVARFFFTPLELAFGAHVFPVEKYRLVREALLAADEITEADFGPSTPATRAQLELVHTPAYLDRLRELARTNPEAGVFEFEAPCYPEVIDAFEAMTGATIAATRIALQTRTFGFSIGGGFHHAMPARGEGFCFLNDIAVAIRVARQDGFSGPVLVVDVDVHQGNGTAVIFQNDASVYTLSIHNDDIYPEKVRSDADIGLRSHTGDAEYLAALAPAVARAFEAQKPELLMYLAGADPFEEDQLGLFGLTKKGLARRDALVLEAAQARGVPVAVTLAGGYARRTADVVDIQVQTARECLRLWPA